MYVRVRDKCGFNPLIHGGQFEPIRKRFYCQILDFYFFAPIRKKRLPRHRSGVVNDYADTVRVSVINNCAETRFSRISSYGAQEELFDTLKKCRKSRDTVPLISKHIVFNILLSIF